MYILVFAVLLPLELLIWGKALDSALAESYLSKRLQLSLFFDLPRKIWLIGGLLALGGILRAVLELGRKSHRYDFLLFCGFPFYMFSLFLYFK